MKRKPHQRYRMKKQKTLGHIAFDSIGVNVDYSRATVSVKETFNAIARAVAREVRRRMKKGKGKK